jgi:hypothetical protein
VALTKNSSRAMQRQIDLTTAVCQERLLTTHVWHVLALVDLISDQVPFDDALDIYVRILRLTPEQARNVGSRALAELGRRSGMPASAAMDLNLDVDDEGRDEDHATEEDGARSDAVFSRLRKRIRGRVQDDLRNRIDLSAARTEDAILETHVENALIFVKALADEISAPEAVDLYLDTMALPEGTGDVIYNRALRTIADSVLPPVPRRDAGADAQSGAPTATVSPAHR